MSDKNAIIITGKIANKLDGSGKEILMNTVQYGFTSYDQTRTLGIEMNKLPPLDTSLGASDLTSSDNPLLKSETKDNGVVLNRDSQQESAPEPASQQESDFNWFFDEWMKEDTSDNKKLSEILQETRDTITDITEKHNKDDNTNTDALMDELTKKLDEQINKVSDIVNDPNYKPPPPTGLSPRQKLMQQIQNANNIISLKHVSEPESQEEKQKREEQKIINNLINNKMLAMAKALHPDENHTDDEEFAGGKTRSRRQNMRKNKTRKSQNQQKTRRRKDKKDRRRRTSRR